MEELWKDIPGYEGLYQASNFGRIRSSPGKTTSNKRYEKRVWSSRIIKPKACRDFRQCGYRVCLWKDGTHKDYLVARLVCTTWHENLIDTKMTVNHKDGDRLNNRIENLEWLTIGDNVRHAFANNLQKQDKTILSPADGGLPMEFVSQSAAARFLERSHGYINGLIENGRKYATSKDGTKYTYSVTKSSI